MRLDFLLQSTGLELKDNEDDEEDDESEGSESEGSESEGSEDEDEDEDEEEDDEVGDLPSFPVGRKGSRMNVRQSVKRGGGAQPSADGL